MFKASIEGTSDEKQGAANIAEKYAYAMTRTTSDTFVDPLTGATSAVCSTYDASANVKAIYASVMLTKDEATDGNNYLVRLTNQDIIIALPLSTGVDYGWGPQFSSYVTCKFRIDRSGITDGNNYFCYFMYYDPSDPTLCLYYDKDFSGVTLHDGKTYSFKGSTDADRANLWATLACGNHDGAPVMDYQSMGTGLSLAQNFAANIPDSIINSLDNYIMYLLPDGVGFCYGGTGRPTYIQGIIYGTLSEVRSGGPNQNTVYGQIKAKSFYPNSDKKTGVVVDVPVASDSILGYVSLKNASVTSINIQYYEY
jgi:hypothetical protein